ncbi:MAG: hypothetical protein ICV68_10720, partial [Pyrinomonadaceae bacterium]|nr:hypothetical protein [Pyrinomonadaceae bacterium]
MKGPIKRAVIAVFALLSLLLALLPAGRLAVQEVRAEINQAPASKISPDLLAEVRKAQAGTRVKVIVQPASATAPLALDTLLRGLGARIKNQLRHLNLRAIELPAEALTNLAARREVRYVSLDKVTRSYGHITSTSGADAVNSGGLLNLGA